MKNTHCSECWSANINNEGTRFPGYYCRLSLGTTNRILLRPSVLSAGNISRVIRINLLRVEKVGPFNVFFLLETYRVLVFVMAFWMIPMFMKWIELCYCFTMLWEYNGYIVVLRVGFACMMCSMTLLFTDNFVAHNSVETIVHSYILLRKYQVTDSLLYLKFNKITLRFLKLHSTLECRETATFDETI